jgi:ATP-binding cassette, subfamily B, bacterial
MRLPFRWIGGRRIAPLLQTMRLLPAVSPVDTAAVGLLILLQAMLPAATLVVTGIMIASLGPTVDAGLDSAAGRQTIHALVVWGILMLLLQVIPRLLSVVASSIGSQVESHMQERVLIALNRPWTIAHLDDPATADLISQVSGLGMGGTGPGMAVYSLVTGRLPSTLTAIVSGALLFAYHWWAALLLFLANFLFAWVVRRGFVQQARTLLGRTEAVRRAEYFRDLALAPAAAKDVRILGLSDWVIERLRLEWLPGQQEQWRLQQSGFIFSLAGLAAVITALLFVLSLLADDAASGVVTIGALYVYLRAAQSIGGVASLRDGDHAIEYGAQAIEALQALERLTILPIAAAVTALPGSAPQIDIRFDRVSFSYPGAAAPALRDLDLMIPAGTSLAVVGLNAAGKTTLVKLLARLYDPTSGTIRVDGVDLRYVAPADWRRRVAAIFQDFQRFPLSPRDNIGFGGLALAGDQEALNRAAAKAGVLDRILALPKGWDTPLARQFTDGADLSGGEWQRVGLARALFAVEAGATILILDEPTAHLDIRAEAQLYDRFLDMTKGLTTILISHRFATVRRADRICVMEAGAVAELGTHDELVALGGTYATLFNLQSARFTDAAASAP